MHVCRHVHAYERSNRVYKYQVDPCGPIHITIGDGGPPLLPFPVTCNVTCCSHLVCRAELDRLLKTPDLKKYRQYRAALHILGRHTTWCVPAADTEGVSLLPRGGVLPIFTAALVCLQVGCQSCTHRRPHAAFGSLHGARHMPLQPAQPRRAPLHALMACTSWVCRHPSFGHGILELLSPTEALWTWHANEDSIMVASDTVNITRSLECANQGQGLQ